MRPAAYISLTSIGAARTKRSNRGCCVASGADPEPREQPPHTLGDLTCENLHFNSMKFVASTCNVYSEDDPDDPNSFARALNPVSMEAIQDILDELETVYDGVWVSSHTSDFPPVQMLILSPHP